MRESNLFPNRLCRKLGLSSPIIQGPMAGGPTTPEMVGAVSEAGGLGSLGAAYLSPARIQTDIARVRVLTSRPFAVNLFAPESQQRLEGDVPGVTAFLNRYHQRMGLGEPRLSDRPMENFDDQLETVIGADVPIVSFTLGVLPASTLARLRDRGVFTIGTATTVNEAKILEEAGVDAVVAQGGEAGGHRATFTVAAESALIGTMALVPQIVDAISIPVIASGGIMDGRGVVAALALGAEAVQMGTAFLCTPESGIGKAYRKALKTASEEQTTVTRAFSGRAARGLRNEFIEAWDSAGEKPLSFPWQNSLTREMRQAAAAGNDAGLQSMWAGQGVRMLQEAAISDLMAQFRRQMDEKLAALAALSANSEPA